MNQTLIDTLEKTDHPLVILVNSLDDKSELLEKKFQKETPAMTLALDLQLINHARFRLGLIYFSVAADQTQLQEQAVERGVRTVRCVCGLGETSGSGPVRALQLQTLHVYFGKKTASNTPMQVGFNYLDRRVGGCLL